jgi:Holliday junction resolvasome RuvABC endonuclease subunit
MPKKPRTLLAIDPGFRELGYAVLRGPRLLASGVKPLKLLPRPRRIPEVRRLLKHWIAMYHPSIVVLEQTHNQGKLTFSRVHDVAQEVVRFSRRRRIITAIYSAQTVRASVVGSGRAVKRDVAVAIAGRYPSLRMYVTQDRRWKERYWCNMFDAIALGLHHLSQPPSRSRSFG